MQPNIDAHDAEGLKSSFEFVKSIYFDATTSIRHYDTLRASFTQTFASLLAIFTSALTATLVQGVGLKLLPWASGVLTLLSLISIAVIVKLNSLISLQKKRAEFAMTLYQNHIKVIDLSNINRFSGHQSTRQPRLGHIWAAIFVVLAAANGILFRFSLL